MKVVNIIKHYQANTDPFKIRTGVKQGCLLSPLVFLVVMDWITREPLMNERTGIQWTLTEQLEDLNFSDDVCLISANQMQRKTVNLRVFYIF